jgi:hypothetical protein
LILSTRGCLQLPVAYIGEAENIASCLREHHRTLDFWDRICFFTQKDDNLTKSHIRYLEARMIQVAQDAKRMPLENKDKPNPDNIPLPESDISDMEYFLRQMQVLLPVLGISLLQPQPIITEEDDADTSPSTAASVLVGGESNGRKGWKVKDTGQSYGEWDEARLAE